MAAEAEERSWWIQPSRLHFAVCASAIALVLLFANPLETFELQWFGQCLRWRFAAGMAPPVSPSVVQLNIDESDLKNLPTLESEYAAAARIVQEAAALGASVVAFDIVFARADPATAQPLISAIAENDIVVLPEALTAAPGSTESSQRLQSFPFQTDRAAPAGLINIEADPDGVIRHYTFVRRTPQGIEPSLAFATYLRYLPLIWERDVTSTTRDTVQWHELSGSDTMLRREMPVGPVLLNLRCPWTVGHDKSAFAFLNLRELDALFQQNSGNRSTKALANSILFVSYVATGQGDLGATAFGSHEPLIYLHSTACNDLMQGSWLRRSGRWFDALWLCSALLVLLGAIVCRSKWSLLVWWALGLLVVLATGTGMLLRFNTVVPTIATSLLWTLATVFEIGRRHTVERTQRQRLRSTIGLYFSPRVLNDVLENPGRLAPRKADITVLLTDLRNSTALAEMLGAEGMLDLLNRVFAVENRAVFAEEGSMEKPVGDQFLAYWGAPDPQADAADRALNAALALISELQELRETFEPRTRELFGYGVALHAGSSLIGNIGSAQFFHYGPVGDLMNATARVESLTKFYGVLILTTRQIFEGFTNLPDSRLVDRVIVKGKNTPLDLIELKNPASAENFHEIAKGYAEAYALYQQGRFEQAGRMFRQWSGADGPSKVLAERCDRFISTPPATWGGIFEFAAK